MPVLVVLPGPMRHLADTHPLSTTPGTVAEALNEVTERYPALRERLLDQAGEPRSFVRIFVGDEDIQWLQNLDTPLGDGQTLTVFQAIAGG